MYIQQLPDAHQYVDPRYVLANGEVTTLTGDIHITDGAGNTILFIDESTRYVGIGTSSVDTLLHLESTTVNGTVLTLESTAANSYPNIRFINDAVDWRIYGADGSVSDAFNIYLNGTGGALTIYPTFEFGITLNTKGVGINETDPDEMLHLTSTTSSKPVVKIENINTDSQASSIRFQKTSTSSAADGDVLGIIGFYGLDSGDNATLYAYIRARSTDVTATDESGELQFFVQMDNANREMLTLSGYNGSVNQGEIVFNEAGQDMDYYFETAVSNKNFCMIGSTGQTFINDNVNTFATGISLTINQGTGTDEILSLKQSNVAHGMTTKTETDTFGSFLQIAPDFGGLGIVGYVEQAGTVGVVIAAYSGTSVTTESTASRGCQEYHAYHKAGTGSDGWGDDDNCFVWRNSSNTRMILKGDGELWTDLAAQVYDDYEDAVACYDINKVILGKQFNDFIKYNKEDLVAMGIISEGGMMSHQAMMSLQVGAISEIYKVTDFVCKALGKSYKEVKDLIVSGVTKFIN